MQQVWAIRVVQLVKESAAPVGNERYETEGLSFSPDGKRLAVVVNHSRLLIVDSQSPETNVRQFDLGGTCGIDVTWNERGDALLVCGTLLRVADGASCDATGLMPIVREYSSIKAFWLDSEHVVRSTGEILDLACKLVGMWQLSPTWQISAVAASRSWVLLWHTEGPRQKIIYQYSLVDRASHQSLSGWPMRKVPGPSGGATLAVGAEAFCFNLHAQNDLRHGKLHCREINSDTEISVPKQVRAYQLTAAAASSARVIAERWEQDHLPWWEWWVPFPGWPALPVRRVVFDLRSGNVIASWKPRIQDSRSPYIADHPYHCALSASGEYLAESGDGSIELYRFAL